MKKSVLFGVSLSALLAATGANAAGYTCEELIEYTSCMPGYYLSASVNSCPDGYEYGTGWCYVENPDPNYETGHTEKSCKELVANDDMDGGIEYGVYDFLGDGCFSDFVYADNPDNKSEALVPVDYIAADCTICPAGSSCAGGTESVTPCPAGSYCATAGLAQPTNLCAKGAYSLSGATECTTCPSTGLKDINNDVVTATTQSVGATSASACFINPDAQFKDAKGIYHFKSNCSYSEFACPDGYVYLGEDRIYDETGKATPGCFEIPAGEECSSWYYENDGTYPEDIDISFMYCED